MSAGEIVFCILLVVLGVRLAYMKLHNSKPLSHSAGRLRMCPSCGRITPRSKPSCLECGKVLTPISAA
jgi:hypothetical protein